MKRLLIAFNKACGIVLVFGGAVAGLLWLSRYPVIMLMVIGLFLLAGLTYAFWEAED